LRHNGGLLLRCGQTSTRSLSINAELTLGSSLLLSLYI
jgi:hypothetical protein